MVAGRRLECTLIGKVVSSGPLTAATHSHWLLRACAGRDRGKAREDRQDLGGDAGDGRAVDLEASDADCVVLDEHAVGDVGSRSRAGRGAWRRPAPVACHEGGARSTTLAGRSAGEVEVFLHGRFVEDPPRAGARPPRSGSRCGCPRAMPWACVSTIRSLQVGLCTREMITVRLLPRCQRPTTAVVGQHDASLVAGPDRSRHALR